MGSRGLSVYCSSVGIWDNIHRLVYVALIGKIIKSYENNNKFILLWKVFTCQMESDQWRSTLKIKEGQRLRKENITQFPVIADRPG